MTEGFIKAQAITGRCEGGYANAKNDRGKETIFGVSRLHNPNSPIWKRLDEFAEIYGRGTPEFIKIVNRDPVMKEWAHELFYQKYWLTVRGDEMPWELAALVYDMGINSGPGTAIKMLTKVLAKMGCGSPRDRVLNDEHIRFIEDIMAGDSFLELMELWFLKRVQKYQDIVREYPDQRGNWGGWINRLKFLSTKLIGYIPTFISEATV